MARRQMLSGSYLFKPADLPMTSQALASFAKPDNTWERCASGRRPCTKMFASHAQACENGLKSVLPGCNAVSSETSTSKRRTAAGTSRHWSERREGPKGARAALRIARAAVGSAARGQPAYSCRSNAALCRSVCNGASLQSQCRASSMAAMACMTCAGVKGMSSRCSSLGEALTLPAGQWKRRTSAKATPCGASAGLRARMQSIAAALLGVQASASLPASAARPSASLSSSCLLASDLDSCRSCSRCTTLLRACGVRCTRHSTSRCRLLKLGAPWR
mmetsp:Transcript_53738/g.172247  ORF Transcript_53738/g.172247 Transcript_53738/m.172247 type:complete len:276 (-) Transcript_53738:186-1013(-)